MDSLEGAAGSVCERKWDAVWTLRARVTVLRVWRKWAQHSRPPPRGRDGTWVPDSIGCGCETRLQIDLLFAMEGHR